jgi:N-methylhydantoinase B
MASTPTLDAVLSAAEVRLAKELGSVHVGEPSHRSVSLARLDGRVLASSSPRSIGNAEAVAAAVGTGLPDIAPGDAVVLSDPYSGSAHVQDHWLVVPVDGHAPPSAVVLVHAHLADVGGQSFGNYFPQARDVWQEGVVTTPVRLARRGEVDADVVETLMLNSRAPVLTDHDLRLMLEIGVQAADEIALAEGAGEAGEANVRRSHDVVSDLAATLRDDVEVGADVHNCGGPDVTVVVRVSRPDDKLVIDLTGSSAQVEEGFVNSTAATTRSAVAGAVLDFADAPANSGVLAGLDVRIAPGSVVGCAPPVAVGWSPFEPTFTTIDLLHKVFSPLAARRTPVRVREPVRPPVRIDGCRRKGCWF